MLIKWFDEYKLDAVTTSEEDEGGVKKKQERFEKTVKVFYDRMSHK